MYKICLVAFIFCMYSCTTKKNFANGKWNILDTARGLSYSVTTKGQGDKGDLAIKYLGWINNDKLVQDTGDAVVESQFISAEIITPIMVEIKEIKQLPKGTTGFIRVNTEYFFRENYSDIRHYTLYFTGGIDDKILKEDSIKLELMGVFKKINIMSSEKALTKFTEDNDTTWRSFIKSNPLPASIELTLKQEFLTKEKYDSIKNILGGLTEATEIQLPYANGLWGLGNKLKQELIYKFVIF